MTSHMEVPVEFQNCCYVIDPQHSSRDLQQHCAKAGAVLVVGDILDDRQMQLVLNVTNDLQQALGEQSPPIVLVPHSSKPATQRPDSDEDSDTDIHYDVLGAETMPAWRK